jgi:hypothetical protein
MPHHCTEGGRQQLRACLPTLDNIMPALDVA